MKSKIGIAILAMSAALVAGCADRGKSDILAEDTSLVRDLALANQDTASKPELRDVPVAAEAEPVVEESTPAPAPAPRRVTRPVVRRTTPRTTPSAEPASAPVAEQPVVRQTESGNTERVTERG